MVSVRLTEQLQRVKEVLKTWKKADERVSQLCLSEGAAKYPSPDTACSTTGKITDGLVGFLSGSFSDDTWRDEYLGVNATVTKGAEEGAVAEKAETAGSSDGVKFQGAWAEWPVGEQGENQLYHFANYNFTLVAAVSIDGEPKEGNIPVLGVKMAGGEKKTYGVVIRQRKEVAAAVRWRGWRRRDAEAIRRDVIVVRIRHRCCVVVPTTRTAGAHGR
ncbi:trans-sialidase [Trypanosoma cruzi Dm28c]|uniref:Trans-sialidase n=1 Tax=Trypanosoma cruzi Dm28c TaxID=1416333 RepID=V5A548_TRYCR|nr:trans-sialidase [Trypanosoma cruzi Dm28c]